MRETCCTWGCNEDTEPFHHFVRNCNDANPQTATTATVTTFLTITSGHVDCDLTTYVIASCLIMPHAHTWAGTYRPDHRELVAHPMVARYRLADDVAVAGNNNGTNNVLLAVARCGADTILQETAAQ